VSRETVIGIDVGGTLIKSAVVAPDGSVVVEATRDTPPDLGTRIGAVVAEIVAELVSGLAQQSSTAARPLAVGVVVPGIVDDARGIGVWSANLKWRDLDLRAAIAPHVDLPLGLGHDVRAGLLAEHRHGAARDVSDVLFVPLGTGVASALLLDGHLVAGNGWAGEIGHVTVVPDGPECGCGRRGCLEAVAGAGAISRLWRATTGSDGGAAEVARRVDEGDPDAVAIWQTAISALADVIAPAVAATGIELVLIGGGLVRSGETLLQPLRNAINERLPDEQGVAVTAAALGDRAGALGAATIARDVLESGGSGIEPPASDAAASVPPTDEAL
jgi:glucokinase